MLSLLPFSSRCLATIFWFEFQFWIHAFSFSHETQLYGLAICWFQGLKLIHPLIINRYLTQYLSKLITTQQSMTGESSRVLQIVLRLSPGVTQGLTGSVQECWFSGWKSEFALHHGTTWTILVWPKLGSREPWPASSKIFLPHHYCRWDTSASIKTLVSVFCLCNFSLPSVRLHVRQAKGRQESNVIHGGHLYYFRVLDHPKSQDHLTQNFNRLQNLSHKWSKEDFNTRWLSCSNVLRRTVIRFSSFICIVKECTYNFFCFFLFTRTLTSWFPFGLRSLHR